MKFSTHQFPNPASRPSLTQRECLCGTPLADAYAPPHTASQSSFASVMDCAKLSHDDQPKPAARVWGQAMTQQPAIPHAALADRLIEWMRAMPPAAVAFSGGIDSTVVAYAAHAAHPARAVAVTADSPSVARSELADAARLAQLIGIRHHIIQTDEFTNPDYLRNDGTRCYHCKATLYNRIVELLPELGVAVVVSGANRDDLGDYRPGLTAAAERGVRHPLVELGYDKQTVRRLAQGWGLPTWDKPAAPCLASRLAPGVSVTAERTRRIELAETLLHELGVRECRVRLHADELARIEVPLGELARLASDGVRQQLLAQLQALGFRFVTLDLAGFRSGAFNQLIDLDVRQRFESNARPQAKSQERAS